VDTPEIAFIVENRGEKRIMGGKVRKKHVAYKKNAQ
jgi:hypothetical protein